MLRTAPSDEQASSDDKTASIVSLTLDISTLSSPQTPAAARVAPRIFIDYSLQYLKFWQQFFTEALDLKSGEVDELMKMLNLPNAVQYQRLSSRILDAVLHVMFDIWCLQDASNRSIDFFRQNFSLLFLQFKQRYDDAIEDTPEKFLSEVCGLLAILDSNYNTQTANTLNEHLVYFMKSYLGIVLRSQKIQGNPFADYKISQLLGLCQQIQGQISSVNNRHSLRHALPDFLHWARAHPGIMAIVLAAGLVFLLFINSGINADRVARYQQRGSQGNVPESWADLMRQVPSDMFFNLFSIPQGHFVPNPPVLVCFLIFVIGILVFSGIWLRRFLWPAMQHNGYDSLS